MNTTIMHPSTEMEERRYFNPYNLFIGAFIPNNVLCRKDLSPAAKLCWARLSAYTGVVDNECITLDKLSTTIGLSIRETIEGIKELKSNGLVQ